MALGERGRGKRGMIAIARSSTSEVGVRRGYRFLRRGAGPLEEGYEWCPPYYYYPPKITLELPSL
eukprot:scaffold71433_cov26-Cyclotella_meneghiniana.AAC.1